MRYLSSDFHQKTLLYAAVSYLTSVFIPVLQTIVLLLSTLHGVALSLLFCGLDETTKKKDGLKFSSFEQCWV